MNVKTHPLLLCLLLGCAASPSDVVFEGDNPGECTDGADNDQDGDFDCDDSDCAASPDCDEVNTTTTSTTTTATTTTATTTATTTSTTTTTTTGTFVAVPTEIDQITLPGCNTSGDWVYTAETLGWTDSNNRVNAWETGVPNGAGWNDEHTMPSVNFDPLGGWDVIERTLQAGASFASYQPNVNTLFQCGYHDVSPVMTYAIRVYDLNGSYADCAIFASDPSGVNTVFSGMEPTTNPVSASSEISSINCLEWSISP